MNNNIFEKNMSMLQKEHIDIYNKLLEYKSEGEKVLIDESYNGEKILAIKYNEHLYYLNSRYNDTEFADVWIKDFENIKYKEYFLLYGLSNFTCVKRLVEIVKGENIIFLYEPDIDVFYNALHITDITEILLQKNVLLCVKGINDGYFQEFLLFCVEYSNMKLLKYICMPNYGVLYIEEWKNVINTIKSKYEVLVATRNTYIKYSREFINNELDNCKDMISQYVLNQLRDHFIKDEQISTIPAIIVAAGPSLNKNIDDIKLAEKNAYIIAVDTALTALLNHNIKPDLVITIDGHKPPILFTHKDFLEIPLVVCGISNSKLLHIHRGKRFYFYGGSSYMPYLYNKIKNEDMQMLESGGSVANNAFSLAQVLGFKNIILVGQDLAYPNDKGHVSDAYVGTEKDIAKEEDRYFEVEDVYGNKVYTETNMNIYRVWFESQIERYSYLKVIDATEGGAKIKGTEILTLREAIKRECTVEIDKKLIDNIEKTFDIEEMEALEKELNGIPFALEDYKKKMQKGIRKYEKLSELTRKGKVQSNEFKKVMGEIDEIVKEIEEEKIMSIVSLYNKTEEYEVLGVVNDVKDDLKQEIDEVINNGIKMFNSYKKGIELFENDLIKRKKIKKEEFEKIFEQLKNNVMSMENENSRGDIINVKMLMKKFMVLALDIIDILCKINSENYNDSVIILKDIIIEFTDKKYDSMVNIMKTGFINVVSELSI